MLANRVSNVNPFAMLSKMFFFLLFCSDKSLLFCDNTNPFVPRPPFSPMNGQV